MEWHLVKHRGNFTITCNFYIYRLSQFLVLSHLTIFGKGKDKVDPVLNEAQHHEDVLDDWRYRSTSS
jgi:hypothetical protein